MSEITTSRIGLTSMSRTIDLLLCDDLGDDWAGVIPPLDVATSAYFIDWIVDNGFHRETYKPICWLLSYIISYKR